LGCGDLKLRERKRFESFPHYRSVRIEFSRQNSTDIRPDPLHLRTS
jgi:hypothetical protein